MSNVSSLIGKPGTALAVLLACAVFPAKQMAQYQPPPPKAKEAEALLDAMFGVSMGKIEGGRHFAAPDCEKPSMILTWSATRGNIHSQDMAFYSIDHTRRMAVSIEYTHAKVFHTSTPEAITLDVIGGDVITLLPTDPDDKGVPTKAAVLVRPNGAPAPDPKTAMAFSRCEGSGKALLGKAWKQTHPTAID